MKLETGYQLEILVNDYRDSKILSGKNGKFIENVLQDTGKRTTEENNNVELLIYHSHYVNVADELKFDVREDGVYAIATLSDKSKNLYGSIKEYGARCISVGFQCVNEIWNDIKRNVNDMQLFEISISMNKESVYNGRYAECRNIEVPYNKIDIMRKRLELEKLR